MFSGHKMQSHFLWVKTSLSSCQITGVHTANERRSHISKSNCFAKIPYNETNSPGNFMSKCGQLNQDLCTFPSNLSNCSSHLPWPEAKSLNLPLGKKSQPPTREVGGAMLLLSTACPALPAPWAIPGISDLLSSAGGCSWDCHSVWQHGKETV